ncbi:endonuclease I family protein [Promicromonospora sp. NPDC057488]|uniref:endonuclease I family protein n=1 Tax=Promicromonospora sp. NPDC057488 TaxID=3346147 RepID=UPI00366D9A05
MRTRLVRARGLGRVWGSGLSALAVAAGVLVAPGAVAQDVATSVASAATATAGAQSVADVPSGYYDSAEGLTGEALKAELNDIISVSDSVSYSEVWDGLMASDEDPANPDNVILLYTGESRAKGLNGGDVGDWNREHVWAKSHGDFGTATGPGTDLHHLRPADVQVNGIRGNKDFDDGGSAVSGAPGNYTDSDSFEPRDDVKGDVARMILYMAVRWEGEDSFADLEPNDTVNNGSAPYHGKLSTLLEWNDADPVSAFEANRNDVIYEQFQHNRNPFIDHPEWADAIWG